MSYSNRAGNKSVMAQALQALVFSLHHALNGLGQFSLFHDVLSPSHNSSLSHTKKMDVKRCKFSMTAGETVLNT